MDTKDIAAYNLVGQTLNATWVVKQRIDKEPSGTGGFFSVCYLVEDRLHNNFFLKAYMKKNCQNIANNIMYQKFLLL